MMKQSSFSIFILLGAVILAALFLGNSDPIPVATGGAKVNSLLAEVPAGGWIAGKAVGAFVSFVLSGITLSTVGFVGSELRKWWRNRQYQPKWKSGPSAYWQKNAPVAPKQAKSLSLDQKIELAMYRKFSSMAKSDERPQSHQSVIVQQTQSQADEFELRF